MPGTSAELARTRGVGRRLAEGSAGATLLAALARGKALPEKDCPQPVDPPLMPNGIGPVTDLLKVLLKMKSEDSGPPSGWSPPPTISTSSPPSAKRRRLPPFTAGAGKCSARTP